MSTATRERIIEATRALLEERPGEAITMADIAAAAGVSRMATYRHFESRAGLLVATVQHVDEQRGIAERMADAAGADNAVEVLRGFLDVWADHVVYIGGLARALLALRDRDDAAAAAWNDRMAVLRLACEHVVQRLFDDGYLDERLSLQRGTDLLLASISVQLWDQLVREMGWSADEYRAELDHLALAVLLADPA